MEITTVGIDLAKSVFQGRAVDAAGHGVVRKALRRAQVVPFFAKLPRCPVGSRSRRFDFPTKPMRRATNAASSAPPDRAASPSRGGRSS